MKTGALLPAVSPRFLVGILAVAVAVQAQQTTGTPGSPDATATIKGNQLPPPPKFDGVIKESVQGSVPWWPPRVVPPEMTEEQMKRAAEMKARGKD